MTSACTSSTIEMNERNEDLANHTCEGDSSIGRIEAEEVPETGFLDLKDNEEHDDDVKTKDNKSRTSTLQRQGSMRSRRVRRQSSRRRIRRETSQRSVGEQSPGEPRSPRPLQTRSRSSTRIKSNRNVHQLEGARNGLSKSYSMRELGATSPKRRPILSSRNNIEFGTSFSSLATGSIHLDRSEKPSDDDITVVRRGSSLSRQTTSPTPSNPVASYDDRNLHKTIAKWKRELKREESARKIDMNSESTTSFSTSSTSASPSERERRSIIDKAEAEEYFRAAFVRSLSRKKLQSPGRQSKELVSERIRAE